MERVSIITLAYNSMDTIYQTIESVLMQDYASIEIVIADDCSSNFDADGIRDYIEKNKKDNIVNSQVYQNAENSGTVKNLNNAIKNCSGEIIMNLSADDMFYDEHIVSRVVSEFRESGCNCLVTRRAAYKDDPEKPLYLIPSDFEIKKIKRFETPEQEYVALFIGKFYNMASGSVFYYRKEYIEKMGYFDESYRLWEDGPFFAKSILADGMIHYNYDIISIRYRLGGISTGNTHPALYQDMIRFVKMGLQDEHIRGFNRRILKKWHFNLTASYGNGTKRFLSVFLYPDVILYQLIDRILFKERTKKAMRS